jgi:deoxyribodipyrimidine photo-lyase
MYNPVKQSHDQDPQGLFIRHWLPALKQVPTQWIHSPWLMPENLQAQYQCILGRDYPLPIINHEQAAREAKAYLREAYQGETSKQASQAVLEKHGSRKPRAAVKRSSKQVKSPDTQIGLFD